MSTRVRTEAVGDRPSVLLGIGALGILLFIALGLFWWATVGEAGGASTYPMAWFVFPAAVLGATVNERSSTIVAPTVERSGHRTVGWWLGWFLWKTTVAIVFAVVLWMLFVSTLVSGELFPAFTNVDQTFAGMDGFLAEIDPSTNADAAKLMVWSFIAGYSERFVPNLVQSLSGGVTSEQNARN
jgi:hypothetical protein